MGLPPLASPALLFVASAAVVAVAGTRLAREGDVIAARTRLGGVWVGSVSLAIATSLPELATTVAAGVTDAADIALMGMSLVALISRARRRFSMLEPNGLTMVGLYLLGLLLVAWAA